MFISEKYQRSLFFSIFFSSQRDFVYHQFLKASA